MRRFQSRIVDANNSLVSAGNVTVYKAGTQTLASLFSGEGLVALANPFKSDHLGVFEFYVEGGDYDLALQDTVTGFARRFYDVSIFDVRDMAVLKSGDSMQGQLRLQSGSISEPGVGFVGDPDTGFDRPGADIIGVVAGGTERARFIVAGSGLQLQADATAALQAVPKQHLDALTSGDMAGNARIGVRLQSAGATSKRRRLNLISDASVEITLTDDSANEEVDTTLGLSGRIEKDMQIRKSLPRMRLTGLEASARDWSVLQSGGNAYIQENIATEASPSWTTRLVLRSDGSTQILVGDVEVLVDQASGILSLFSASTEMFVVDEAGRVGIRRPSPTAYVHARVLNSQSVGRIVEAHPSAISDLDEWMDASFAIQSRIHPQGYFVTRRNIAPATASLSSGELAWWFDPTNGAAKVWFYGKTYDGTLRSQSTGLV